MFQSPWRGSPEEGRRGGFDSHDLKWAPEPPPGSTPGRHLISVGLKSQFHSDRC